ncbi:MAG: hypothetical protein IPH43_06375 [Xanthomonadales bacterium]|nr:hypothetical protein [Xanthomonadales bacterium]
MTGRPERLFNKDISRCTAAATVRSVPAENAVKAVADGTVVLAADHFSPRQLGLRRSW